MVAFVLYKVLWSNVQLCQTGGSSTMAQIRNSFGSLETNYDKISVSNQKELTLLIPINQSRPPGKVCYYAGLFTVLFILSHTTDIITWIPNSFLYSAIKHGLHHHMQ